MMTGDGLLELRRRTTLVRGINPRGARHWGAASRRQTSHEGSWCQASMGPALLVLFQTQIKLLTDVGLRSCGRRTRRPSAAANPQGCWPRTPSVARARFPIKIAAMTVSFRALRSVARAHLYRLRL